MTLRINSLFAAFTGTALGIPTKVWVILASCALALVVLFAVLAFIKARKEKLAAADSDTNPALAAAQQAADTADQAGVTANAANATAQQANATANAANATAQQANATANAANATAQQANDNNVKLGEKVGDLDKKVGDLDKKVGDLDKKVGDLDTEVNQQKVAKALVDTLSKRERISTALDRVERVIRGEVSKTNSLKYQFARTDTSDLSDKDSKVAAYQQAVVFASQMASEFEGAEADLRRATARGASDEELEALNDALDAAKVSKDDAAEVELEALKALMDLKESFKSAIEALKKNFDLQPSIDKVVAQGEELKKIQKWINELPAELAGTAELTELTDKMAEVKAINTDVLEELKAKVDDLIADYEAAIVDVESVM